MNSSTSATMRCDTVRVIADSAPRTGHINMALDELLLNQSLQGDFAAVRVYQWVSPTLTLGYFQKELRDAPEPLQQLDCVRRLSGGGAILHDRELTYSCSLPASHPVRRDPSLLYSLVHDPLIELLNSCGAEVCLRSDYLAARELMHASEKVSAGTEVEPFLCFLRSNGNDIVSSSGIKVVGSAQRRRRGAILQHGSILLQSSPLAPQLTGLRDLFPDFDTQRLRQELPQVIADAVACSSENGDFTGDELAAAERSIAEQDDCSRKKQQL